MSKTFVILSLFTRFPFIISSLVRGACVPNTQFILNGRVCRCDSFGQWGEENCKLNVNIDRRSLCVPGTILWQGCNHCICKENGHLSCSENVCSSTTDSNIRQSLSKVIDWCTPFRYYYLNCNICVCPASGRTIEARCALDNSCTIKSQPLTSELSKNRNVCIPKVMYLFPCLHCLCSDEGVFTLGKCVETCPARQKTNAPKKCKPGTFYKSDCNVCKCPTTGISDQSWCTKSSCDKVHVKYLKSLRNQSNTCTPFTFTMPRCLYCDCAVGGIVDENACYELECLKSEDFKYDETRLPCSPGEMVPICVECLCLRYGQTLEEYCSRSCSYRGKLQVLEKLVQDSRKNDNLIDNNVVKRNPANDLCLPNSVYKENGRYCLCPDNGNTNFNLCSSAEEIITPKSLAHVAKSIDFNATCEPNTYVDFYCNSCFCSKNGTIDPKWCTYDDCEAKKIIQDSHASYTPPSQTKDLTSLQCTPGSMSRVQCNFCICPNSGLIRESVCTKNTCDPQEPVNSASLVCEPLAYYEVDCNVCFCPHDGIKNVAKCTKNHCEKSFLRSEVCIPGQLFIDECNVCICPPNGSKEDKACTNYPCSDTVSWQKIFQLSESLIGDNLIGEDATRNLNLCFPGEEFVVGCKLCVCSDMGLRNYATCSSMGCKDDNSDKTRHQETPDQKAGSDRSVRSVKENLPKRRAEDCMTFTFPPIRKECSPGSMYIVRCKQCICPYMGPIDEFCRPLPKSIYCEQAYPGVNYVAMGRRAGENDTGISRSVSESSAMMLPIGANMTSSTPPSNTSIPLRNISIFDGNNAIKHDHTIYKCDKIGRLMDRCFICECEEPGQLIEEHCFRSEKEDCADAQPSFLGGLIN